MDFEVSRSIKHEQLIRYSFKAEKKDCPFSRLKKEQKEEVFIPT